MNQSNNLRISPDYTKSTAEFGGVATNTQNSEMLLNQGSFKTFAENSSGTVAMKPQLRDWNSSALTFD